jgi:hypothetical protein
VCFGFWASGLASLSIRSIIYAQYAHAFVVNTLDVIELVVYEAVVSV